MEFFGELNFDVVLSVGGDEPVSVCREVLGNVAEHVQAARAEWAGKIADLYERLPVLTTDNALLNMLYDRSLLSFLFCKWNSPDFVLNPYYSEAGMDGGAICAYLWGFGYISEIFPVYDVESARNYIIKKGYLLVWR